MQRTLTVNRRRAGIVDTYVPKVAQVVGYRLKAATNFDAAFATIFTSTNVGFVGAGVDQRVLESQPLGGKVRMVWNPTDYGLDDKQPVWVQLFHVDGGGAETQVSACTLIMPDETQFLHRGSGHLLLRGSAPAAATVAGSLQLDLPRLQTDWRILNESSTDAAYVSFEPGGGENKLPANATYSQFHTFKANSPTVFVRSGGVGPVTLSIQTTNSNPF